ncbi:MAG: substrate-binding domain-containing protein [bacterium]
MSKISRLIWFILFFTMLLPVSSHTADRLKLSSTTSTDNTGLLAYILPVFEEKTGVRVDVIAVGTGRALKLAENGDVDATLVHAPEKELHFEAMGHGVHRQQIMANYFVIVGPGEDPAGIANASSPAAAFERVTNVRAPFISRGDESGTHTKEIAIWKSTGKNPTGNKWYLETGKGMGETLTMADEKRGYTLSDMGSFLKFRKRLDLEILFQKKSDLLFNPYSIIAVNPERHPHVNYSGAVRLIEFLSSPEGQSLIGDFTDGSGNRMFEPLVGSDSFNVQGSTFKVNLNGK